MTIKPITKVFAALLMSVMMVGASANSISVAGGPFGGAPGDQISLTINYDFTDFAMFGGGLNLFYDASLLQFDSYTRADHSMDQAQDAASAIGMLGAPGEYLGFGIGTFDFFGGMTDAGSVGTFVFTLLSPAPFAGGTVCGQAICLSPDIAINPFTSLAGADVTDLIFPMGDIGIPVDVAVIPVPAAVWFMISGLGALLGFGRRSA